MEPIAVILGMFVLLNPFWTLFFIFLVFLFCSSVFDELGKNPKLLWGVIPLTVVTICIIVDLTS